MLAFTRCFINCRDRMQFRCRDGSARNWRCSTGFQSGSMARSSARTAPPAPAGWTQRALMRPAISARCKARARNPAPWPNRLRPAPPSGRAPPVHGDLRRHRQQWSCPGDADGIAVLDLVGCERARPPRQDGRSGDPSSFGGDGESTRRPESLHQPPRDQVRAFPAGLMLILTMPRPARPADISRWSPATRPMVGGCSASSVRHNKATPPTSRHRQNSIGTVPAVSMSALGLPAGEPPPFPQG